MNEAIEILQKRLEKLEAEYITTPKGNRYFSLASRIDEIKHLMDLLTAARHNG